MMERCWALLLPPHPPRWAPIAPGAEIVSGMAKSTGRSRRVSNGLVGLGSAAVLTIYGAGYLRTRPAAARIALAAERRPVAAPHRNARPIIFGRARGGAVRVVGGATVGRRQRTSHRITRRDAAAVRASP